MATETPATQAKRILVVEDEVMIRMLLEDMLGELGYTVVAEAARIDEALEATKNAEFDLAILDANLNGQPVSPVADALVARGTPFVFATGYGEPLEPHRDRPTLKKPFQMDGLKQSLQSALDSGMTGNLTGSIERTELERFWQSSVTTLAGCVRAAPSASAAAGLLVFGPRGRGVGKSRFQLGFDLGEILGLGL
jgi:CheY-like chemotaxis protein